MYVNRLEEQRKKDALMATPKRFRPKLNEIYTQEIQKPNFENLKLNSPAPSVKEPELLLTPEYSKFPSAIRVTIPQPHIPAIFYPQKLQENNQQDQHQSVTYFNKPQASTKAEIMVDGAIVMIRTTNNETLTFNKKLMIGFQASIGEEKLTVFLKSNRLVAQMIYNEDWAKIIEVLHLIITNRNHQPSTKSNQTTKPTWLSKLAKCFQKKQHATTACQTGEQQQEPVSP